jgi:hypothetical protein
VLLSMVNKTVMVRGGGGGRRRTLGLGQRCVEVKKKLMTLIILLEKDVSSKVR